MTPSMIFQYGLSLMSLAASLVLAGGAAGGFGEIGFSFGEITVGFVEIVLRGDAFGFFGVGFEFTLFRLRFSDMTSGGGDSVLAPRTRRRRRLRRLCRRRR